jgi:hypothetical protein
MNNRTMFKFGEVMEIAQTFGLTVEEFLGIPTAIPAPREQREAVGA